MSKNNDRRRAKAKAARREKRQRKKISKLSYKRASMLAPVIYSCYSRLAGKKDSSRLSDKELAFLARLLHEYACLYNLYIKNLEMTDDGFQCELKSSREEPSKAQVIKRFTAFYEYRYAHRPHKLAEKLKQLQDPGFIARKQKSLCSISCYMHDVKMCFAKWYNKCHDRIGPVFSRRFSSIETAFALLEAAVRRLIQESQDVLMEIPHLPVRYEGIRHFRPRDIAA